MVLAVRVLDDGGFVVVSSASVGDVLFESGGQVPTSLADVHLPTFAGDPVDTRLCLGVLLVLVGQ